MKTAEQLYPKFAAMESDALAKQYDVWMGRYTLILKNWSMSNVVIPEESRLYKYRKKCWENLKAIIVAFKDRFEWDDERREPNPWTPPKTRSAPMWKLKGLKPGTEEWKEHWLNYPSEQAGMAKHSIRQRRKQYAEGEI